VSKSRGMGWVGHVEGKGRWLQGFVGDTKGKRPFGRPRRKWECNNKIDSGIGRQGLYWAGSGEKQAAGTSEEGLSSM
jgi:hypothetical protein